MLSWVKFIPPEQVEDDGLNAVSKERKNSDNRKQKDKSKEKSSRNSSSDDDELDKTKKHSRKRTWYSSDENSSSESDSDRDEKKQMRKGKKIRDDSSSDYSAEESKRKTRFKSGKNEYTSEEGSLCSSDATDIARKEMGLDWMLRSESTNVSETKEILSAEVPVEEDVFEVHMTRYRETQQQSTDRPSQDPTKERREEYDNWVEASEGKSGDQVLGSGSFDPCFYKGGTSYTDSPPSSSSSTAHSARPSAEQSHLVRDLVRQLSELKHQIQELREEGKRSEERW